MKYLVTGGLGFIGYNFIQMELAKSNNFIVNVDKNSYYSNKKPILSENYVLYECDMGDSKQMSEILSTHKPDLVLNFAAETHVDRSIHFPADFVKTNVLSTFNLLEEVKKYYETLHRLNKDKFRFFHISTDEVFGSLEIEEDAFYEDRRYDPSSPYSATKAASDHLVNAWHKTYGLPTITTNCSNNYGPFQYAEKLIPLILTKAISGQALPIYGTGQNIRDWLFVADHCEAIKLVLEKGRVGETYCIGGDSERTNMQVVEAICDILDEIKPRINGGSYKTQITFIQDRLGHDKRYAINFSKINKELGWAPRINFEEGIRKTVIWYVENLDWLTKSSGSKELEDWYKHNYQHIQRVV